MGKFSNSRNNFRNQPDSELELETDFDMEFDLDLDEENGNFAGLSESPLYSNTTTPQPAPRKKRSVLIICLCAVVAMLLLATIAGVLFVMNGGLDDGLILPNVSVAGVDIGGEALDSAACAKLIAAALK